MSLCLESPAPETVLRPVVELGEKRGLMKNRPPSAFRQIVGFNLKVPLKNEVENTCLRAELPHAKQLGGSPKSPRPSSGLESLLCSPHLNSDSTTLLGAVGLVADLNEGIQLPKNDILLKHECVHSGTTASDLSTWSHHQYSTVFRNKPKHSHPIPIFQPAKLQSQLFAKVQEQKIGQNQLPYDEHEGHAATPLPLASVLPLRPNSCAFVSVFDNEVEKYDIALVLDSIADQSAGTHTACFAPMDFMKACFLCKSKLGQGLDIYMYRGDRAFCSADCRHQQIVFDERVERRQKCSSAARSKGPNQMSRASTIAAA
ncbi:hypothetical protein O6H91_04G049800 [Diphasiastrum complanatum]|uniref:Uncharacterized protein n=2 Tax=Diphasiastrum complanatum TaxID=34168 RepID=A0ACC2DWN5_DIPCM|nr:hypothetical protein O6H91_04G047800 [Diphasiastrum complanatum]KAJ7558649.1 hypothetical protein O6H91_04G049800 [Diphasiastrum complanatum]